MNSELYDVRYFDMPLRDWVFTIHTSLSSQYGITFEVETGDFGFDSYVCVIETILRNVTAQDIITRARDLPKFREYVHKAWCHNYILYKDANPGKTYRNPDRSIITHERNDRVTTKLQNVSPIDIMVYDNVINIVFDIMTDRVLEMGFKNLNI